MEAAGKRTLCRHLPLAVEIALVADDDHGEVVLVLYSQNLLLERHNLLEALPVGYRVDEQEALSCAHVLLAHGRVLLLSRCIEHIEQGDLIVNDTLLAVRIWRRGLACWRAKHDRSEVLTLDGRVVLVYEVALDQLDSQTRLSDSTAADYHQLVFSEKLARVSRGAGGAGDGRAPTFDAIVNVRKRCRTKLQVAGDGRGVLGYRV
jgi:hypothetical protein